MQYSMKTDKGIVRASNQDNCCFTVFDDGACFAIVCDGMGGPNAGDVASAIAIKEISDCFVEGWNKALSENDVNKLLSKAIKTANLKIFALAESEQSYKGMGTTVVAAFCCNGHATVANVGDSRAYLLGDGVRQLTKDHSLVQELLDQGKLTEQDAAVYPHKNVITRAVGIGNHVDIDLFSVDFSDNTILLCSDGLYNFVDECKMTEIINSHNDDFEEAAVKLIDAANNNGGGDNITALLIKQ